MHESRLVRDLLAEAESRASGRRIETLRLSVGAMASVSTARLRHGAQHAAGDRWGYQPQVEIETNDDVADPGALGVTLVSLTVGES